MLGTPYQNTVLGVANLQPFIPALAAYHPVTGQ